MFQNDKIACWLGWHLDTLALPDLLHLLHRPPTPHRRSPDKSSFSIGAVAFIVAFRRRSEKPLSSEGFNLTYVVTVQPIPHLRLHT